VGYSRAVNATEISPKTNVRLNRIKIVSRIAKYVFWTFFLFSIGLNLFIFGNGHILKAIGKLAPIIIGSQIILAAWYWKLARLFRLYERGLIFTSETIQCIKILGILCVAGWLLGLVTCLLGSLRPSGITSESVFTITRGASTHTFHTGFFSFDFGTGIDFGLLSAGIVIVLVAWIMDEGRKIREEQELTV
jgi:Protein of unknown function (DUF2975)